MVFTISFLSKYGELGGFFPKLYMFLQAHKPFLFSLSKKKKNKTLTWRGKTNLVWFIERSFCWKNVPKVARFRGKKEFRVHLYLNNSRFHQKI
jgi:hypothetical protein